MQYPRARYCLIASIARSGSYQKALVELTEGSCLGLSDFNCALHLFSEVLTSEIQLHAESDTRTSSDGGSRLAGARGSRSARQDRARKETVTILARLSLYGSLDIACIVRGEFVYGYTGP